MNLNLKNFFIPLFLLLVAVLFFWPYLNNDVIPYSADYTGSDLTELNLPLRFLVSQSIKQGEIPLWTDLLAGGFPLLAEGQAGVFYPFNLIIFSLLPFIAAVNISLLVNFYLAEIFVYLYARILKISRISSVLSAIIFSFSGFFIFRLKHLNMINAAIWLPLEFYLIEKYFLSRKKSLFLVLLSLVFSIQFFAGHPQISYLSLVSCLIYFVLRLFLDNDKPSLVSVAKKTVIFWLATGIITFGVCAIQFLPSWEFYSATARQRAVGYEFSTLYKYSPAGLLNFITPYWLGNPANNSYNQDIRETGVFWENNIYFGVLALVFSLLATFYLFPINKKVRLLTILGLSSFLIIFNEASPLFAIFYRWLPGFSYFRFHQRFLLLTLICGVGLAGFGFDFIWTKLKGWQAQTAKGLNNFNLAVKILFPVAVGIFIITDLFLVGFNYLGVLPAKKYFSVSQSAEFLKQDKDIFRISSLDWPVVWQYINQIAGGWHDDLPLLLDGREIIWPNLNVFWQLPAWDDRGAGEGGLSIREIQVLKNRLKASIDVGRSVGNILDISDQNLKIFGLLNVKYFLSFNDLQNDNLSLKKEIVSDSLPPLKIYENLYFLPWSFGVPKVDNRQDLSEALETVLSPEFNPLASVVVSENNLKTTDDNNQAEFTASTKITINHSGRKIIDVNFSQPGWLFISQPYFSGWQAQLDGSPAKIFQADYAFSAVEIPAGKHQVIFSFEPKSYIVGKSITLISLLSLAIYLLFLFFYRRPAILDKENVVGSNGPDFKK